MDTIEALRILRIARDDWARFPKNCVHRVDDLSYEKEEVLALLFEHSPYQVLVYVTIGPKCGLTERCVVIDTEPKEFDVDHLFTTSQSFFGFCQHTFLPNPEFTRPEKRDRSRFIELVRDWMDYEFGVIRYDYDDCGRRIKNLRHHEEGTISGVSLRCTGSALRRT